MFYGSSLRFYQTGELHITDKSNLEEKGLVTVASAFSWYSSSVSPGSPVPLGRLVLLTLSCIYMGFVRVTYRLWLPATRAKDLTFDLIHENVCFNNPSSQTGDS